MSSIAIHEALKAKIAAVEPFSKEELEAAKKQLPREGQFLLELHRSFMKEFSFLVEASIIEGLSGNIEQSVHYHKLSYQFLQFNGMLMEHARGEGPMEHYMEARKNAS